MDVVGCAALVDGVERAAGAVRVADVGHGSAVVAGV